jgi:hypothetical protein
VVLLHIKSIKALPLPSAARRRSSVDLSITHTPNWLQYWNCSCALAAHSPSTFASAARAASISDSASIIAAH